MSISVLRCVSERRKTNYNYNNNKDMTMNCVFQEEIKSKIRGNISQQQITYITNNHPIFPIP